MQNPFRERVASRQVMVADGAMGTLLYSRGIRQHECFDAQNIERPDVVEQIHRDYISAGADLIETNTFGANRARLAHFGYEDRVVEINQGGARIARAAREVCGQPVFVAGSMGPTGRAMEPYGQTTQKEMYGIFREQVSGLLQGGVDLIVLETFGDLREITQAVNAIHDECDLPIVAQMTFTEDLHTPEGFSAEQVVRELLEVGVDVVGANCSVGSNSLLAVTQALVSAGAPSVSAMPNAGWPIQVGNRVLYLSSPDYMAEYGQRMADAGAILVGGCCGTTPGHIKALRQAIDNRTAPAAYVEVIREPDTQDNFQDDGAMPEFSRKLGLRRVVSVEIRPPRGANPAKALEGARVLKAAGVDAVNVLDSAMSRVRMSSIATAMLIQQHVQVDAIVHFTTRDRNLMAIQSDLIGAHAMGIRNVLALTGDPPAIGDYATSKPVHDVDSVGLIRIIKQFNTGVDVSGNSIGTPTKFLVGASLNPTAEDLDWELKHFRDKIDAGADFVMTQPVYDPELFARVLDRAGSVDVPILMGVLPLQSYRHALFIHNELPGVKLTDEALSRMELAGSDGVREGLQISRELIERCGGLSAGLYIVPSFGRYEVAAGLVAELALAH